MKKIVLVYSGGLDTSVCIPLMKEEYGFDHVITVTIDVGQPRADIEEAEKRATELGTEHYTVDARAVFVEHFCWPALRGRATRGAGLCAAGGDLPMDARPEGLPGRAKSRSAGLRERCAYRDRW